MTTTTPRIFLLSLSQQPFFDEQYSRLIDKLALHATLQRASKPTAAINYLANNRPAAVLITDEGITIPKYAAVLEKVAVYARSGGTVVFMGHFSSFVHPEDLENLFRTHFDLPWKRGDYYRTTVHLSPDVPHIAKAGLPAAYSQKTLFLKNVASDAALYSPSSESVTQSLVFPSQPVTDLSQAAVAFGKVGEGWVGYLGDVNAEVGSDAVIMAMCGL